MANTMTMNMLAIIEKGTKIFNVLICPMSKTGKIMNKIYSLTSIVKSDTMPSVARFTDSATIK